MDCFFFTTPHVRMDLWLRVVQIIVAFCHTYAVHAEGSREGVTVGVQFRVVENVDLTSDHFLAEQ